MHTAVLSYRTVQPFHIHLDQYRSARFWWSSLFLYWTCWCMLLQQSKYHQKYCLGIEMNSPNIFLEIIRDISCKQDDSNKEFHLIEVNRNIHNFIKFYIKQWILVRIMSRFIGCTLMMRSLSLIILSNSIFSSWDGEKPYLDI